MTTGEVVGALDIGGTHVSGGRVNVASASLEKRSRVSASLPAAGGRTELLEAILRVARSIAAPELRNLGVAVPGPFDHARGVSQITHKLEAIHGVDLRSELHAAMAPHADTAIHFLNDAEAFLLGEWWSGAAREHVRAVGITLGTGLGSAFCEEGEIVRSGAGVPQHGELYAVWFRDAPVEQTISRAALLARYGARVDEDIDVEQIADRAREGERAARRVFADLGTALGQFLAPWLRAYEPTCLVVGGSIARSWDLFEDTLRVDLESVTSLRTVTVAAQLEDAPLLGAAYYATRPQR